jgi:hypothetical protein
MDPDGKDLKDDPEDKYLKDPKDPNAWWAVPFPPSLFPPANNLSRSQKRRVYLIAVGFAITAVVVSVLMCKLMR